jgi:ferredoxin-type protein NapG
VAVSFKKRSFLRHSTLVITGLLSAGSISFLPRLGKTANLMRPPGAIPEESFISKCIKCGLCVNACPVDAIQLADVVRGIGLGTLYIDAREQSCGYSCDNLQCVKACPSGALRRKVIRLPKTRSRMGIAVLTHPQQCLAGQGKPFKGVARGEKFSGVLRNKRMAGWKTRTLNNEQYQREPCDLCVLECPIPKAIQIEENIDPITGKNIMLPKVSKKCLGCGVCEMVCPTKTASIRVIPRMKPADIRMGG